MSFYKRSFHSFLDQTKIKTMAFKDQETSQPPHLGHHNINGFIPPVTRDPSGMGFADEADGLMLCTEYLGFESYDMRIPDNEVENKMTCHSELETERVETKRRKTKENVVVQERKKKFPPPLSSLNGRGQRSFYFQPVRKDGRLELTQVMIDRPEIFHASREDGRLRLHLFDSVNSPMRAYCEPQKNVDLEDKPNGLDQPVAYLNNENEGGNISGSDLESSREMNEDNNDDASDQVVDLSMINDDSGVKSWRYHEDNNDDDVHDAREWRYKSCYKLAASMNHDGKDHHHHHHHHHIHPYHHSSNNNMHLWSRTYVKTR